MMRRALCKTRVSVCFAALFGCALPTLACSGGEQSAGRGHASDAGPGADGSALFIASLAAELAYTYDPSGTNEAHAVWQFRPDPDIFARIWGGAQRLDNGNTLVCFGSIDLGTQSTISEVSAASKPVWEVRMPLYWGVYRARRMTTRPRGSVVP